jgi:hypothetical protein
MKEMREKLQKFTAFTNTLLPHEVKYLLSVQQFHDDDRLRILQRIAHNIEHENNALDYDIKINKRKYSNLKNWIVERLQSIDVDVQFEWMTEVEKAIMTDSISVEEEKKLLKAIRNYKEPIYYFQKFHELIQHYRHFLLIRMRYADHKLADDFLKIYKKEYDRTKRISDKIHEATLDIVNQYASPEIESKKWEKWLIKTFYDETLDGHNRYLALIRLTFMAFNYRNFDGLLQAFDVLDDLFKNGKYYSKRLLLNYYGNRLLLHTKFKELDKAVYYGYLSIRGKNNEYIHYINNLSAVLQRQERHKEALDLMRSAFADMKATQNYHDKIGFVAFYGKALNHTKQYQSAENYCESFLRVYKEQIFKYRWHIFFTIYMETLLYQEKYDKIQKVTQKYQLLEKDSSYQKRPVYLPTITWYVHVAAFRVGQLSKYDFRTIILDYTEFVKTDKYKFTQAEILLKTIQPHIPEVIQLVRPKLYDLGIRI